MCPDFRQDTVVFYCDLLLTYINYTSIPQFLPSTLPKSIEPLFSRHSRIGFPLLSPNPFNWALLTKSQFHYPPACARICLHSMATPLLSQENLATIPRSPLALVAFPGGIAKSGAPLSWVGKTVYPSYPSSIAFLYCILFLLCVFSSQRRYNLHRVPWQRVHSLVSRILMAGKLAPLGLTTSRNYSMRHGRIPVRDLPSFRPSRLC
jgi:hypothetical protein